MYPASAHHDSKRSAAGYCVRTVGAMDAPGSPTVVIYFLGVNKRYEPGIQVLLVTYSTLTVIHNRRQQNRVYFAKLWTGSP